MFYVNFASKLISIAIFTHCDFRNASFKLGRNQSKKENDFEKVETKSKHLEKL
jgi:hypothetical protein